MQAETLTLHKILKTRLSLYEHQHRKSPSVTAVAQMLSTLLYSKRFFPFYTFNILAGVDNEGKGAVFPYDAIGSYELTQYHTAGTGGQLMMGILDNQIGQSNQLKPGPKLTKTQVIDLVKDSIASAAERDIYTGDKATVVVIDGSGSNTTEVELRKD
eukprot:GHVT01080326.1.p1 GENE.GHVT01080326.1~~GHVT01080326.1.p1  ORF type:complete len:157 (+),score=37.97 GHVT01080326.1:954-1424(+)